MQEGYLDIQLESILMKINPALYKSNIDYIINEGNIYKINSLKISNLKDNYKNEINKDKLLV